jgi:dihydrofolate synthase / folylpolyglutamate synthase
MATAHIKADEPFFREWLKRRPGQVRDLERAKHLLEIVSSRHPLVPVLGVVGSKGKGTTATYAAAALSTAARTSLVTSPSIHTNRERFRFQIEMASEEEYQQISRHLEEALKELCETETGKEPAPRGHAARPTGYLSPTGLFTIAGVIWSHMKQADIHVAEAGIGGASDEMSLLDPVVLAVSEIFLEHTHLLGDTVTGIATDKLGAAGPRCQAIVALAQGEEAMNVIRQKAEQLGARLIVVDGVAGTDRASLHSLHLPPGLGRRNAILGLEAAQAAIQEMDLPSLDPKKLAMALATIQLPGRLSVLETSMGRVVLDASVSAEGVKEALRWCEQTAGRPVCVLLGFSKDKSVQGVEEALRDLLVVPVKVESEHLEFPDTTPWGKPVNLKDAIARRPQGTTVVLGTWSVIAEAMAILEDA